MAASAYASSMQMGGSFGQAQGGAYMKSPSAAGAMTPIVEPKNFTGEVFFDDVGQGADGNRPKRVSSLHYSYSSSCPAYPLYPFSFVAYSLFSEATQARVLITQKLTLSHVWRDWNTRMA